MLPFTDCLICPEKNVGLRSASRARAIVSVMIEICAVLVVFWPPSGFSFATSEPESTDLLPPPNGKEFEHNFSLDWSFGHQFPFAGYRDPKVAASEANYQFLDDQNHFLNEGEVIKSPLPPLVRAQRKTFLNFNLPFSLPSPEQLIAASGVTLLQQMIGTSNAAPKAAAGLSYFPHQNGGTKEDPSNASRKLRHLDRFPPGYHSNQLIRHRPTPRPFDFEFELSRREMPGKEAGQRISRASSTGGTPIEFLVDPSIPPTNAIPEEMKFENSGFVAIPNPYANMDSAEFSAHYHPYYISKPSTTLSPTISTEFPNRNGRNRFETIPPAFKSLPENPKPEKVLEHFIRNSRKPRRRQRPLIFPSAISSEAPSQELSGSESKLIILTSAPGGSSRRRTRTRYNNRPPKPRSPPPSFDHTSFSLPPIGGTKVNSDPSYTIKDSVVYMTINGETTPVHKIPPSSATQQFMSMPSVTQTRTHQKFMEEIPPPSLQTLLDDQRYSSTQQRPQPQNYPNLQIFDPTKLISVPPMPTRIVQQDFRVYDNSISAPSVTHPNTFQTSVESFSSPALATSQFRTTSRAPFTRTKTRKVRTKY